MGAGKGKKESSSDFFGSQYVRKRTKALGQRKEELLAFTRTDFLGGQTYCVYVHHVILLSLRLLCWLAGVSSS